MKSAHEIVVEITGTTDPYRRELDKASKASEEFGDTVEKEGKKAGAGFDKVGEGADGAETRIMGLKDTVDGTATIMKGPGEQGIAAYIQGWADLASGIANFVVPAFQAIAQGIIGQIAGMASAAAATIASVATQVAQWIVMGATAAAQAAVVAAAWLVSIGPLVLVAAAVVGLVVLIVKNWDTIVDATKAAFDFVVDIIKGAIDWVRDNWPLLLAIITGPIGLAVLAITTHWDTIKELFAKGVQAIKDTFAAVYDFLVDPFRRAFDKIKELFDNTVGKLKLPSWLPGDFLQDKGKGAPAGAFAGAAAVPALAMSRAAGRAAPTTVNITVQSTGLGADAPAIQRAVANALRGYTARNGPLDIRVA